MNKDNINLLIERLRYVPRAMFGMDNWVNGVEKGCPRCIAGHAAALSRGQDWHDEDFLARDVEIDAKRFLGLTYEQARHLFKPDDCCAKAQKYRFTLPIAIRVLEVLRDTGEIKWWDAYEYVADRERLALPE